HFLRKPKVPITSAIINGVNPGEVASAFTAHWRFIMVEPPPTPLPGHDAQSNVLDYLEATLIGEQHEELDKPLHVDELGSAIKTLRRNESPGLDGWPDSFFQTATATFAQILVI
ncbi:unnamed protein product, partial [Aphanomyces euteiches]